MLLPGFTRLDLFGQRTQKKNNKKGGFGVDFKSVTWEYTGELQNQISYSVLNDNFTQAYKRQGSIEY